MRQTLGHGLSQKGYEMVVMYIYIYIHLAGRVINAQRDSYLYTFVGFSCQESCGRAHGAAGIFDLLMQVFKSFLLFFALLFLLFIKYLLLRFSLS
jgi:hypothetical protein